MFYIQREKNNNWFDCGNISEFLIDTIIYKQGWGGKYPGLK